MSRARAKGTSAETALVRWLQGAGWPSAERLPLQGRFDKGDVRWVPRLAVEVKNVRTPKYGEWLREAEAERVNMGADYGVVVHKPHGTPLGDAGRWHVVMTLQQFAELVREGLR